MADMLKMSFEDMEDLARSFDKAQGDLIDLKGKVEGFMNDFDGKFDDWIKEAGTKADFANTDILSPLNSTAERVIGSWQGDRHDEFENSTYPQISGAISGFNDALGDFSTQLGDLKGHYLPMLEGIIDSIDKGAEQCDDTAQWVREYTQKHRDIEEGNNVNSTSNGESSNDITSNSDVKDKDSPFSHPNLEPFSTGYKEFPITIGILNTNDDRNIVDVAKYVYDSYSDYVSQSSDGSLLADGKVFNKILGDVTKLMGNDSSKAFGVTGNALTYLSSLKEIYVDGSRDISKIFSLTKNSTSLWKGIYEAEKLFLNKDALKEFTGKFAKPVAIVSTFGDTVGLLGDINKTMQGFVNNNDCLKQLGQIFKTSGSALSVGQDVYVLSHGFKSLTGSVVGNLWAVKMGLDAVSGGLDRLSESLQDNILTGTEMNDSAMQFALSGLLGGSENARTAERWLKQNALPKLNDFVDNHVISRTYRENASWLIDYANDTNNNVLLRAGANLVGGTGMVVSVALDAVGEATSALAKWVGSWFK